ncbi:hypothetical protein ACFLZ5_02725 [Thermodesulfobacteriota bacterium]
MKFFFINTTTCSLALILLILLPVSCSGQEKNTMQKNVTKDATSFEVPDKKKQFWESLKNNALKNYDICQEHCAYEQNCLDKCKAAYNSRLEREYYSLLNEKKSGSDK